MMIMRIFLLRPKRRKIILTSSKAASNDQAKLAGYGH